MVELELEFTYLGMTIDWMAYLFGVGKLSFINNLFSYEPDTTWSPFLFIAWIVYFFFYLAWANRTYANLYAFNQKTSHMPSGVVVNYLFPIINFFMPYKDMKEILIKSSDKEYKPYLKYIKIWWLINILQLILTLFLKDYSTENSGLYLLILVFLSIYQIYILLTTIIVRFITQQQDFKWKIVKTNYEPKMLKISYSIAFIFLLSLLISSGFIVDYYNLNKCNIDNGYVTKGGDCACYYSYTYDILTNKCIKDKTSSKNNISNLTYKPECPIGSTYINGACICNDGYQFDYLNNTCISEDAICNEQYGNNTNFLNGQCFCNMGYEWNKNNTGCIETAFISVTKPDAFIGAEPIIIEGNTSDNCSKIIVTASNDNRTVNDTYTLTEYSKGDTKFRYIIKRDNKNLAWGPNHYMFTAYCNNDQIKQTEIDFFYSQEDPIKPINWDNFKY